MAGLGFALFAFFGVILVRMLCEGTAAAGPAFLAPVG